MQAAPYRARPFLCQDGGPIHRIRYINIHNEHENKITRYKLTQASNKRFSFLLHSTYGGKTFKINDGRTVKWGSLGKKRSKKYTFQLS